MNDAKHTPGPWVARVDGPFVCGGDSTVVEAIAEDGGYVRREIATLLVDTGDGEEGALTFAEDIANARLIAAAPELLEACKLALAYISHCVEPSCNEGDELEDGTIDDGTTPEGNALRAALAKATGGQP